MKKTLATILLAILAILALGCTGEVKGHVNADVNIDPAKGDFSINGKFVPITSTVTISGTTATATTTVTNTATPTLTRTATATATISGTTSITPTATATSSPTATRTATSTVTNTATVTTTAKIDPQAAHFARLEQLDPVFRSQGTEAWLKSAGITWDTLVSSARQPEEETSPKGKISVSGKQIDGTNIKVMWPIIVTTDTPGRITETPQTIKYQPDPNNGSVLYTNVIANGPVTIWISGYSWGQFTSVLGTSSTSSTASVPASGPCFSIAQLDTNFGIDRTAQGSRNGLLYDGEVLSGATLRLTSQQITELTSLGWTIQGSNPLIKSAWSPTSCRPLSQ